VSLTGRVPAIEFVDNLKKGGLFMIGDTVTVPPVPFKDISQGIIR
jgi:hypothetical protein